MPSCLLFGDSLAVGLGTLLGLGTPAGCDVVARVGAGAEEIAHMAGPPRQYDIAVVSVGSNDTPDTTFAQAINEVRIRTPARRIVWLLPYRRQSAAIIASHAATHRDLVIDAAMFKSRDGIHPRDYGKLAKLLRTTRRPQ